jgi:hypothetical protein
MSFNNNYENKYKEFKEKLFSSTENNKYDKDNVNVNRLDLFYMCDQLIQLKNDNYVLRQRIFVLESVIKWALNFVVFIGTFSNLLFQNNISKASLIFNIDLIPIPFKLLDHFYDKCDKMQAKMMEFYTENFLFMSRYTEKLPLVEIDQKQFKNKLFNFNLNYDREGDESLLKYLTNLRINFEKVQETLLKNPYYFNGKFIENMTQEKKKKFDEFFEKMNFNVDAQNFIYHQTHMCHLLTKFATSIFSLVPQLQVDLVDIKNAELTIDAFIEKLDDFWHKQVNLAVEPFQFSFNFKNMNETSAKIIEKHFESFFNNRDEDFFEPNTSLVLCVHKHRELERVFTDPVDRRISEYWKSLFNKSLDCEKDEQIKKFTHLSIVFLGMQENMFNKKLIARTYQLVHSSDYLTNLKFTVFEQNCLLKLIIYHLILQMNLDSSLQQSLAIFNPITFLLEKIK